MFLSRANCDPLKRTSTHAVNKDTRGPTIAAFVAQDSIVFVVNQSTRRSTSDVEKNPLVTGTKALLSFDDLLGRQIASVGDTDREVTVCGSFLVVCYFNRPSPKLRSKCLSEQQAKIQIIRLHDEEIIRCLVFAGYFCRVYFVR